MNEQNLEYIKSALISIGFSEEEAIKQIRGVGELIQLKIKERILFENQGREKEILENPEKFLEENYGKEKIVKLTEEVSREVVTAYFQNITKNLSSQKRDEFYANFKK